MIKKLTFRQGITDALPIFFGYLSVSFAFGMIASGKKIPVWISALISATSLTGTGQFVGIDLIGAAASLIELACTIAVINARYFLMSLSLAQRLPDNINMWQRLIVAYGNTDEIFAVSMLRTEPLNMRYICGLIICSWSGWVGGTVIGGLASGIIPRSLLSAFGIALYAMFTALIIPPAKKDMKICFVIAIAAAISSVLYYIPALSCLGSGWIIIIAGVTASAAGALLFPHNDAVKEEAEE